MWSLVGVKRTEILGNPEEKGGEGGGGEGKELST